MLADALWKCVNNEILEPCDSVHYVLDDGALLHRIPWPRGITYDDVSQMYVSYVVKKYGDPDVVFFGYSNEPSTKDATHMRRTGGHTVVTVNFTGNMIIQSKKDEFLNNVKNKQHFLDHLSSDLEQAGDADLLIAKTAVMSARSQDTVLVGGDTDLLVLLLHHAEMDTYKQFFAQEPKHLPRRIEYGAETMQNSYLARR